MQLETPDAVLTYWFGELASDEDFPEDRLGLWWGKDPTQDYFIRQTFEPTLTAARRGMLDAWREEPRPGLAWVVVMDQFPRNMYRNSSAAFEGDEACVAAVLAGLEAGQPQQLRPVERVFYFMPLMHSEELEVQERAVELFRELAAEAPAGVKGELAKNVDFAVRHRDIVARFGRFPHRNKALGRESTKEEREFLLQPGSSF